MGDKGRWDGARLSLNPAAAKVSFCDESDIRRHLRHYATFATVVGQPLLIFVLLFK